MMAREVKNFLPQIDGFKGIGTNLLKKLFRERTFQLFLKEGDIFLHLILDIIDGMFLDLIIDKGSVKEKDGDIKGPCLKLIPFDDRTADVVATH